ncbi:MAG: hypothetical protein HKO92_09720 [Flavobacteriaceae bacterium]|nr:hypothetical protein [Flavobacteriaceae bacterium]
MKTISTVLAIFISAFVFGQTDSDKNYKLEDVKISIEVNSIEDIDSIDFNKIETFLEDLGENEPISFAIVCRNESNTEKEKNELKLSLSGNSNNKEAFIKRLSKMKNVAIKFYK